jgi:hypothetical protein
MLIASSSGTAGYVAFTLPTALQFLLNRAPVSSVRGLDSAGQAMSPAQNVMEVRCQRH